MVQGEKRTDLVLDKPAREVLPGALLLALKSADKHRLVTGGLHVKGTVHVWRAVVLLESWSRGSASGR